MKIKNLVNLILKEIELTDDLGFEKKTSAVNELVELSFNNKKSFSKEDITLIRDAIQSLLPKADDMFWELESLATSYLALSGSDGLKLMIKVLTSSNHDFDTLMTLVHETVRNSDKTEIESIFSDIKNSGSAKEKEILTLFSK